MNNKSKYTVGSIVLLAIIAYASGIASQLIYALMRWLEDGIGGSGGLLGAIMPTIGDDYAYQPQSPPLNIALPLYINTFLLAMLLERLKISALLS